VTLDLAVLGQDPHFGGGSLAQAAAFLTGALELGRKPELLYSPHPAFHQHGRSWRRVEAFRQLESERTLVPEARGASSLWVVATAAHHGGAAPRTGRDYGCWLGTAIDPEWHGRALRLGPFKRLAAAASLPTLRTIERRVVGNAARLYATSPASAAEIAAAACRPADEIGLLPIPVDSERFFPEDDEKWLDRAQTAPLIGFVGRADDPRKNVALLLDAFSLVRNELPAAELVLVGSPPDRPASPGVQVTGVVDDVAPFIRRFTLLVLPSFQEGFGIVVAEALASGVPAIVTPCGGPEAILWESGAGRISPGWSARELADTILGLLGDLDALAAARVTGRVYVEREHAPARFRTLLAEAIGSVDG
jgi:glycosyltransferase involved in cell wall biosynthesis